MLMDVLTYLTDQILVKLDRAAMAVSLETRAPYLDHRVFELAWRMPLDLKIQQGVGKLILRRVLGRHLPLRLIDRPKMGFSVPMDRWLRGPLRDWAESLLDPARLASDGYLRAAPIRQKWADHVSGRRNWHLQLWDVLTFQAWLDAQRSWTAPGATELSA
jgi:asparagine synthase (glutamine-hydrolysing)